MIQDDNSQNCPINPAGQYAFMLTLLCLMVKSQSQQEPDCFTPLSEPNYRSEVLYIKTILAIIVLQSLPLT